MHQDPDRSSGWIRLHRKLQENPLWTERREFSRAEAWLDILLNVQHSEEQSQILVGNCVIECGRGQSIKSLETWGSRWNWNKSKVRRFFKLLQDLSMIRHESVTKTTRITVCNYDTYNPPRNASETQVKRKRNAVETQVTPDKNVRMEECNNNNPPSPSGEKGKLTKKAYGEFGNVKLTEEEHSTLVDQQGKTRVDAGIAILDDYIESKGKRYKSHYATMKKTSWVWKRLAEDNASPRGFSPGQVYHEDTDCPL